MAAYSKNAYEFTGKKILVTGGSGFLGSHLCRALSGRRAEVHAVSRRPQSYRDHAIHWWQGDLTDVNFIRQIAKTIQPNMIFHLTGFGVGAPDLENVLPTLQNDLVTTVNMLTITAENRVERLLLAASLEEPQPGSAQMIPSSPYAAAKWAGSSYAQMFYLLYKTPVVMVRPYMTYGPGQPSHKMIPQVILSLLKGEAPKLSSGRRPIDWVFVDDVIEGFLAAAHAPDIFGQTIDLGSGDLITIREVVEMIVRLSGVTVQPRFGALPDRPQEKVRVADTGAALEKLDWHAATSLESGLKQTIVWYREHLRVTGE